MLFICLRHSNGVVVHDNNEVSDILSKISNKTSVTDQYQLLYRSLKTFEIRDEPSV